MATQLAPASASTAAWQSSRYQDEQARRAWNAGGPVTTVGINPLGSQPTALPGTALGPATTVGGAPPLTAADQNPTAVAMRARQAARLKSAKDAQAYGETHSVPALAIARAQTAKAATGLQMPTPPSALQSASEAQLAGQVAAMKARRKFTTAEGVLGPRGRRNYGKAATTTLKAGGGY